jgi:hypothetical protein
MVDTIIKIGEDNVVVSNVALPSTKGVNLEACEKTKGLCGTEGKGRVKFLDEKGKELPVDKKTGKPKEQLVKGQLVVCEWGECKEKDKNCECYIFERSWNAKKDDPFVYSSPRQTLNKEKKRTELDWETAAVLNMEYRCFCLKKKG